MCKEVSDLRKLVLDSDGKTFKRGTLSRLSEYLDLSRASVRNILEGEWSFGEAKLQIARDIIKNKKGAFPLYAKKSPGRPRNKV